MEPGDDVEEAPAGDASMQGEQLAAQPPFEEEGEGEGEDTVPAEFPGVESTVWNVADGAGDDATTDAAPDAEQPPEAAMDAAPSAEQEPPDHAAARVSVMSGMAKQLQELAQLTTQQAQQLELEGRTRAELEDMLQRIERHFRNEQAIRRRAEEAEAAAAEELAHERDQRLRMEEELRTRSAEAQHTDALKANLQAEYLGVKQDKARVDQQLQEARNEAKRALSVLAKTEEGVRQAEGMERLKLEAEHNARITRLTSELDSLREELNLRTRVVAREMGRWRAQAEAAATAVRDAKDELMDRKRELDVTKDRMDSLVEKLYVGRVRGLELRGAIASTLERLRAVETTKSSKLFVAPVDERAAPAAQVEAHPHSDVATLEEVQGEAQEPITHAAAPTSPSLPSGKAGGAPLSRASPGGYAAKNARRTPNGPRSPSKNTYSQSM